MKSFRITSVVSGIALLFVAACAQTVETDVEASSENQEQVTEVSIATASETSKPIARGTLVATSANFALGETTDVAGVDGNAGENVGLTIARGETGDVAGTDGNAGETVGLEIEEPD